MSTITTNDLKNAIDRISHRMFIKYDEFNELDGKLGDGDIGITMKAGCEAVLKNYEDWPEDFGTALIVCAKAFVSARASSYGTLIASGLMSAAAVSKGKTKLSTSDISPLLKVAREGMAKRGKSELGQKTVLDALEAAYQAADSYKGNDFSELSENINNAVRDAVEIYKDKPNLQGRARMFGEKSVGITDPGMQVFLEIVIAVTEN